MISSEIKFAPNAFLSILILGVHASAQLVDFFLKWTEGHVVLRFRSGRTMLNEDEQVPLWKIIPFFVKLGHICLKKFCGGKVNESYSDIISGMMCQVNISQKSYRRTKI